MDINGDGSARNDPAFVDPDVPGVDALFDEWECLRDQAGGFAERNSCRAAAVHRLDVRFALGLARIGERTVELIVDGLNLLDPDVGLRDRALYLLDPEGSLEAGPDGTVTVPLIANPEFGERRVRNASGRVLRLGLQVRF